MLLEVRCRRCGQPFSPDHASVAACALPLCPAYRHRRGPDGARARTDVVVPSKNSIRFCTRRGISRH